MKKKIVLMFCLFALLSMVSAVGFSASKSIYVSINGDDVNSGLTIDQPKKTVAAGLGLAVAGDTIYLLPGVYPGNISIKKRGEPDKPITIMSYSANPGEYAVIDGGAPAPALDVNYLWLNIKNASWLVVKNLKFQNGWTDPISIQSSSYLTFDGCIFNGGRRVIYSKGMDVHHLLVQNCFWDQGGSNLWTMVTAPNGLPAWDEMHHGSLQYYNGSLFSPKATAGSHVLRYNKIQNAFNGFRWKGDDTVISVNQNANMEVYGNEVSNIRDNDFEPEGTCYNLHVYQNRSHNIHKTMSVDTSIGGYIYYYGNVITADSDPWSNAVCTGWWKVYGNTGIYLEYPMYAFNNSFYGNCNLFYAMPSYQKHLNHFNNAYYISGDRDWSLDYWDSTMTFDYDCSNKPWPANIINNNQEQHGKVRNPMFVDGPNRNLRLQSTSPCIDAGRTLTLPEFGWTLSFKGKAPDIGAYEGDNLVEGPPFKFMNPPGGAGYEEMPRIVRHKVGNKQIRLYFSNDLITGSITAQDVSVMINGQSIPTKHLQVEGTRELLLQTTDPIAGQPTIIFRKMPVGANGQSATIWASTIPCLREGL